MHYPAKRGWLSLKLAGVRGSAPPYYPSAQRWALTFNSLKPKLLLYSLSTNLKSRHWPSSSKFSTAGTGRHMEPNPCKPSSVAAVALRCAYQAFSEIIPTHSKSLAASLLAGGFPCHSEPLCLSQLPEPLQRGVITLAIAILDSSSARVVLLCHEREPDAVHQGGSAARSCRLCLIACNSRKFTRNGQTLAVPEEGLLR
jgi:hypothetical protein